MDMQKVAGQLKELLRNPGSRKELGRVARNLGHELPHNPRQALRQLQAALGESYQALQQSPSREAGFAAGVFYALMEVCAAYDMESRGLEDQRVLDEFTHQPLPQAILQHLGRSSGSLEDLRQVLREPQEQIARALEQLQIAGVVEPDTAARARAQGVPFRLTPDGYWRMTATTAQAIQGVSSLGQTTASTGDGEDVRAHWRNVWRGLVLAAGQRQEWQEKQPAPGDRPWGGTTVVWAISDRRDLSVRIVVGGARAGGQPWSVELATNAERPFPVRELLLFCPQDTVGGEELHKALREWVEHGQITFSPVLPEPEPVLLPFPGPQRTLRLGI